MVTPLGQRMVFQTANAEAVRAAHDVATQLQRDEVFKKVLADRMSEDNGNVQRIAKSEEMKAEERRERQRRGTGQQGRNDNLEDENESTVSVPADEHTLDFMA